MAFSYDQEDYGFGGGVAGPFRNPNQSKDFSESVGLAPARNSQILADAMNTGIQAGAQYRAAKEMAEAYKAANKPQGGGFGGILGSLASSVGGVFLGPVAGAAGKALTKGLFG